jgi:hypothetical protein
LTVPVMIVFLILFASADLVFQKYAAHIFDIELNAAVIAQTVIIAFVTLAFMGAFAYIFGGDGEKLTDMLPGPKPVHVGNVEISILLGSVSALFLLFILVQLVYLFGGVSNISGQGFTYAEYARRGFFELLTAVMATFAVLWATDNQAAKSATGHTKMFRVLSSTLVIEVIVIISSAFKRLYLYEQAFGFTTLRLYSHTFTIFLAIIFVLFLVKILRNQTESYFALPTFVCAVCFLVAMNLLNPDAFIARQNLDRFQQTGKLDGPYIGGLSEDARSEVKAAVNATTGVTKQQLIDSLAARSEPPDWQSWNVARRAAR